MSVQTIYAKLVRAGMTPESACGMMGNMQAESAMRANNAQDGFSEFSDEVYTSYADRGLIDFVNDQIGYGLCQWTLASRKQKMLNFHRQRGVSIGDEDTQVDFCILELLTEYASLWQWLCTNKGVAPAAERICREYERPAHNNVDERAGYANEFYMTLSGMDVSYVPVGPAAPTGDPIGPEYEIFHIPAVEIFWPPRVLDYGKFGGDVVALQGLLVAHGYTLTVDGQFGNKTRTAVMAFQAESGLVGDGVAGADTWTMLLKR